MTRVHLGCGGVYLDGYVNIDKHPFEEGDDSRSGCVADVYADAFDLPYPPSSLSEIVLIHGLEHFTRYDGVRLLRHLSDLLAPGGVIYLEMPSRNPVLVLSVLERTLALLAPRRVSNSFGRGPATSMLWGNQWAGFDYETHRYLWTPHELAEEGAAFGLHCHTIYRLPASHVPFRDMGVAFSKGRDAKTYHPPKIRRLARRGLSGDLIGFGWGVVHVVRQLFSSKT